MGKRYWEDLTERERFTCRPVAFDREGIVAFGKRYDPLPFHADEVRAVPMAEMRLNEAAKMGFSRVVLPASNAERLGAKFSLELLPVRHVKEALSRVAGK
jgi:hypothetical protein